MSTKELERLMRSGRRLVEEAIWREGLRARCPAHGFVRRDGLRN
jgi:hypothetical protein